MTARGAGRDNIRSPQRPLPMTNDSPLAPALLLCLGKVEISLRKWPPEYDAAHAAIDVFQGSVDEHVAASADSSQEHRLELPLSQTGLSVRTVNFLERQNISTVGDLVQQRREDLMAIPRIGRATLEEIFLALARLGFKLPPAEDLGMASGTR